MGLTATLETLKPVRLYFPVHLEPPIKDMGKKLIINASTTGAFINGLAHPNQNPHHPLTMNSIVDQAVETIRAGAAIWHGPGHLRDGPKNVYDPALHMRMVESVLRECPDVILSCSPHGPAPSGLEHMTSLIEPLIAKSRRYVETAVLTPAPIGDRPMDEDILLPQIKYLNDKGIKPEIMHHNQYSISSVNREFVEKGTLEAPYFMYASIGMHHSAPSNTPWCYYELINMLNLMPPNTTKGVSIGGRNWLPLTLFAIMLGVDVVRVGMEDTIWLYPHRNELIKRNIEALNKVVLFAKELGRELASPEEARRIIGLR